MGGNVSGSYFDRSLRLDGTRSLAPLRTPPLHPVTAVHLNHRLAAVIPADPGVEVQYSRPSTRLSAGHDSHVRPHGEPARQIHRPDLIRGELVCMQRYGGGAGRGRRGRGLDGRRGVEGGLEIGQDSCGVWRRQRRGAVEGGRRSPVGSGENGE